MLTPAICYLDGTVLKTQGSLELSTSADEALIFFTYQISVSVVSDSFCKINFVTSTMLPLVDNPGGSRCHTHFTFH